MGQFFERLVPTKEVVGCFDDGADELSWPLLQMSRRALRCWAHGGEV